MKKIVLSLLIVLLAACSKPEGDRNSNEKSTIQTQEKSSEKVDDLFLGYWKNKGTPDLRNKLIIEIRQIMVVMICQMLLLESFFEIFGQKVIH
ncbi:hypothetical protein [Acinetobacter sp. Ac_5812]|uniref:hypothetical protein n=1 Tax=Acinetobacter sp. Ac_5812 TaxID=1848937 RepID=UPI0014904CC4|nr:hypothetical protein [Acinetobacter sp. Ac_5812]NNP69556.1 hypothetical protein [Acinetobacter sp. Ac_5812]